MRLVIVMAEAEVSILINGVEFNFSRRYSPLLRNGYALLRIYGKRATHY